MKVKKLCHLALLSAAALVIFVAEAQIPVLFGVPGIKPGLANIIVLIALLSYGPGGAGAVLAVKLVLGSAFSASPASFIYSAAGGVLALAVMIALRRVFGEKQTWALSAFGAVAHNAGQLLAAVFVLGSEKILLYFPVLLISGAVTGAFTGLCAQLALPLVRKAFYGSGR